MNTFTGTSICNNKREAVEILEGFFANNINLIDFVEEAVINKGKSRKLLANFVLNRDKQNSTDGLYHHKMIFSEADNDPLPFLPLSSCAHSGLQPRSESPLTNCEVDGWFFTEPNCKLTTPNNTRFSQAIVIKFPYELTSKYIISFENEVSLIANDYTGKANPYEELVINITHENLHARFYLFP